MRNSSSWPNVVRSKRQGSSVGSFSQQDSVMLDITTRSDLRNSAPATIASIFGAVLCIGGLLEPTTGVRAETAENARTIVIGQGGGEYRLGVRDKVKLQVYEWRPARDEVFTWTAINQVYVVDAAGKLTIPLIGQVNAAGFTTAELASLISRKLAHNLNLGTIPDTTVEITEFRPVFVAGHVERAGEYAFSPGLTVLQAVSLGGGLYRNAANNGLRLEREFVTVSGEYDRQMQERQRLIVRKARLEAELAFADHIAFPKTVRSDRAEMQLAYTSSLMAKERSVFDLRRNAYDTQIKVIDQLKSFLENEVTTFGKRLEAQQSQIDMMKSELGGIKSLSNKGLATQPRLLGMLRNLAQLEGEKLRMESDRTRAQQEVSRAELSRVEFENRRENELTVELQVTESRLEQVIQEALVSERLLIDTQTKAASSPMRLVASQGGDAEKNAEKNNEVKISYTIVRQIGAETVEIDATETSQLLPGDTVKVAVSVPSLTGGSSGEVFAPFIQLPVVTPAEAPSGISGQPERASIEPTLDKGTTTSR